MIKRKSFFVSKHIRKIELTITVITVLCVSLIARALVASFSVYAVLLANVLPSSTFIQISTGDTIGIQQETRWARANEAALGILAIILAMGEVIVALVDV